MTNFNIIKTLKTSTGALALMGCFLMASCNPTIDGLAFEGSHKKVGDKL